jgi:chemotaxis protein MotB
LASSTNNKNTMKSPSSHRAILLYGLIAGLLAMTSSACVSQSKYDDAMSSLEDTNQNLDETKSTLEAREEQLAAANDRVTELEEKLSDIDSQLATCERSYRGSLRESDELRRRLSETQQRMLTLSEECTQRRSQSAQEREELEETLEAAREEQQQLLEEVNRLREEAERRQQIYQELVGRFQSMIDAGQLDVSIENGRIVINLPQDILFRSGSANVSREGETTLSDVGEVLADFRNRSFQVEGHTDDVPISTARFPSNWELSSARALAVLHILVDSGVPPENLSAAGYGEFQPVAPNDTRANKALNRRIEIVMLPNIEELAPESVTTEDEEE